jgi:hypothetical protein
MLPFNITPPKESVDVVQFATLRRLELARRDGPCRCGMSPERQATFGDEALLTGDLMRPQFSPRSGERFVDIFIDAPVKPDRLHRAVCFAARSPTA